MKTRVNVFLPILLASGIMLSIIASRPVKIDEEKQTTNAVRFEPIEYVKNNAPKHVEPTVPAPSPIPTPIQTQALKLTLVKEKKIASRGTAMSRLAFGMDLRTPSNYTPEQLNKALKGSKLQGLGSAYIAAEEKHRVNALFLVSVSVLESGWGKSSAAVNKNNLFGIYSGGSLKTFSSKVACIDYAGNLLSDNYLSKGGKYFNGYTLSGVNKKYSTSSEWDTKVYRVMLTLLKRVMNR